MTTRHVMIVTSVLPPKFHGGTPRLLRWCDALPRLGWRVSLAGLSGHPHLLDQDPPPTGVIVHGTRIDRPIDRVTAKLRHWIKRGDDGFPDGMMAHMARLCRDVDAAIRSFNPDVVMVTVPSFSLLTDPFLSELYSARRGRIVIDARDHLSQAEHWLSDPKRLDLAAQLQRRAALCCDGLAAVTHAILDEWKDAGIASPFAIVPNSFARTDWDANAPAWPGRARGEFVLTFTGMAHGFTRPAVVLPGAVLAAQRSARFRACFRFRFVGLAHPGAVGEWDAAFPGAYRSESQLPYARAKRIMAEADALLTVATSAPLSGGVPGGKVYEYMGARRPILAVWDGMASSLVQLTRTGLTAHPDNPEQIADRLLELFDLWERNQPFPFGDPSLLEPFEVTAAAQSLVALFENVLSQRGRAK